MLLNAAILLHKTILGVEFPLPLGESLIKQTILTWMHTGSDRRL